MRLIAAVAIACVAFPSIARAKEYGQAGTIEIGGQLSAGTRSAELEDDAGTTTKFTSTSLAIRPEVGFFLLPGVELIGAIGLGYEVEDDDDTEDTTTSFGLGVGGAFLLPVGRARIGPQLLLTYTNETQSSDDGTTDSTVTAAGPGLRAAGVAKMPIGEGGVITAGIFMEYEQLTLGGDADDTQTSTTFGTAVGVSIYF